MLEKIGVGSIEELFCDISPSLRRSPPTKDDGMSESEVLSTMEALGKENTYLNFDSYLGAGAYQHYIPALVGAVTSRSEFLTSYTPYQPEASQGYLQAMFEFQTAIATLTGLDVANSSLYDGASAAAEAILMALRIQKEKRVVIVSDGVHPLYLKVIKQYLFGLDVTFSTLEKISGEVACVLVQSPNFFGVIEEMSKLSKLAHDHGALFIAAGNPLSYPLLMPPGEYGADIAVGDCQPFGIPLEFGGPYAGYIACKKEHLRNLPGRIVGETLDKEGKRGFVLTLQAREQHIRRDKATSNICTNQALCALASLVTMLWYGPKGLYELALTNYQRAHYLADELVKLKGFSVVQPFFNEFCLELPCDVDVAMPVFEKMGIIPGLPLAKFFPKMRRHLLIAVTEMKTIEQLSRFIEVSKKL